MKVTITRLPAEQYAFTSRTTDTITLYLSALLGGFLNSKDVAFIGWVWSLIVGEIKFAYHAFKTAGDPPACSLEEWSPESCSTPYKSGCDDECLSMLTPVVVAHAPVTEAPMTVDATPEEVVEPCDDHRLSDEGSEFEVLEIEVYDPIGEESDVYLGIWVYEVSEVLDSEATGTYKPLHLGMVVTTEQITDYDAINALILFSTECEVKVEVTGERGVTLYEALEQVKAQAEAVDQHKTTVTRRKKAKPVVEEDVMLMPEPVPTVVTPTIPAEHTPAPVEVQEIPEAQVQEQEGDVLYRKVPHGKAYRYHKVNPQEACGEQLYRKVKNKYVAL